MSYAPLQTISLVSKLKHDSQSICVAEILNSRHNTPCAIQIASPIITSYLYSSRALMLSKANCNHKHWVRFVAVYLALFVWTVLGQISIHSVFIYTVIHMRAFADWSINQYFFSCYGDIFRCEIISVRIVKVIFLCRSSTIRQLLYIIKRANTLLEINPKLAHRFVESIRVLMNEKSIFMSDFGKICASRAETEEIQNFGKAKKKMHNVVWCCRRRYQTTLIGQMVPLLAGKQSWVALATGRWKPTTNKSWKVCTFVLGIERNVPYGCCSVGTTGGSSDWANCQRTSYQNQSFKKFKQNSLQIDTYMFSIVSKLQYLETQDYIFYSKNWHFYPICGLNT